MTAPRNPPKQRSPHPLNHTIPSLELAVQASNARWTRDLGALHEHARERFGDVSWVDTELLEGRGRLGANAEDTIWGHKGMEGVELCSFPMETEVLIFVVCSYRICKSTK